MNLLRQAMGHVFGDSMDPALTVADAMLPSAYGDLAMPLPKSLRGRVAEIDGGNIPADITDKAKDLIKKLIGEDGKIKVDNTYNKDVARVYLEKPENKNVAKFEFLEADDYIQPRDTRVQASQRRKGIASDSYQLMEELFGKKLVRDDVQTDDAKALWDNPNRKFGGEYSPRMEKHRERGRLIDIWSKEKDKLDIMKNSFSEKYGPEYLDKLTGQEKLDLKLRSYGVDALDKRIRDLFKDG